MFFCAHANFLIRCEFFFAHSKTHCSLHGTIDAAHRDLALHKTSFVGAIKFEMVHKTDDATSSMGPLFFAFKIYDSFEISTDRSIQC